MQVDFFACVRAYTHTCPPQPTVTMTTTQTNNHTTTITISTSTTNNNNFCHDCYRTIAELHQITTKGRKQWLLWQTHEQNYENKNAKTHKQNYENKNAKNYEENYEKKNKQKRQKLWDISHKTVNQLLAFIAPSNGGPTPIWSWRKSRNYKIAANANLRNKHLTSHIQYVL